MACINSTNAEILNVNHVELPYIRTILSWPIISSCVCCQSLYLSSAVSREGIILFSPTIVLPTNMRWRYDRWYKLPVSFDAITLIWDWTTWPSSTSSLLHRSPSRYYLVHVQLSLFVCWSCCCPEIVSTAVNELTLNQKPLPPLMIASRPCRGSGLYACFGITICLFTIDTTSTPFAAQSAILSNEHHREWKWRWLSVLHSSKREANYGVLKSRLV